MQVLLSRWGNSLGLRVPREVATRLGLTEGSRVEIAVRGNQLVVSTDRPVYRLEDILKNVTPKSLRQAFDWGPDAGREDVS